jgi:hypothetical protein
LGKLIDVLKSIPDIISAASQSPFAFWITIIIGVIGLAFLIAPSLRRNPYLSLASLVISVASVITVAALGAHNMSHRADPIFSTGESSNWWVVANDYLYTVALNPKDRNHMSGTIKVSLQPKEDKEVYGSHGVDLTYDPGSKTVELIRHMSNCDDHFKGNLVSDNTVYGAYIYKNQKESQFEMYRQFH